MFDAHMHFARSQNPQRFENVLRQNEITCCTLQCIAQQKLYSTVPDALWFKSQHPDKVYVNGSFERSIYLLLKDKPQELQTALLNQAKALLSAGCDGIKMLEGKPDIRRIFPIPDFDSEIWEAFWDFAEKNAIPLTIHLNDPEEFWDESKVNPYARAEGWFYGPETINNEEQYRQMEVVFSRHPGLRIQLAHMYFLSAQLPRLSNLLRKYQELRVDLTPGIEMYTNMAKNIPETRKFFSEFEDRILYGSDIGSRSCIAEPAKEIDYEESSARVNVIRTFLESPEPYTLRPDGKYLFRIEPVSMQGLGLSDTALEKIYGLNARAFFGSHPVPVDQNALVRLEETYKTGLEQIAR